MTYSFIDNFIEYLNNNFNGQIPNLIFFSLGILIGIILFIIAILILFIITKANKKSKKSKKEIFINEEYKSVILANIDIYTNIYLDAPLMDKLKGIGKISINMLESISALYYPNSDDSMFEISIEQLVDFLSYFSLRLNYIIDKLLQEKLQVVDFLTNYKIKDKKLSFVIEMIEKNKNKKELENKNGIFNSIKNKIINSGKKIAFKVTENIINDEIINLLISFGEDINKLYSKQELTFTDLTKKQLKEINKLNKKAKRKQGDLNA